MSAREHAERTGKSASRAEAAKVVPGGDETLQKVSGCGGASTSGFCGFVIFAAPETRKCGFGVTVINSLRTSVGFFLSAFYPSSVLMHKISFFSPKICFEDFT